MKLRSAGAATIPIRLLRGKSLAGLLRIFVRDGSLSVDGLDVTIRGLSLAIVVVLCLFSAGQALEGPDAVRVEPLWVALAVLAYNLAVIGAGVPWRAAPAFPLFVLDWLVASLAIFLTGGFGSPFIILYYALIIGAALRLGLTRSVALVAGCAVVFLALGLMHPDRVEAIRLPILVAQTSSLLMVMLISVGMKRAVEVEAQRAHLEEQTASRLRLLNELTAAVLTGAPDLERVLFDVAVASRQALESDSGLAVLILDSSDAHESAGDGNEHVIVADRGTQRISLSGGEKGLLDQAVSSLSPIAVQVEGRVALSAGRFAGLERDGVPPRWVACAPFVLESRAIGAILVGRVERRPFTLADVGLLTAISQQVALAVRLARLYELERERANRSSERERLERDLLSMVSHDLRTPLTAIKTSIGALADTAGTEGRSAPELGLLRNIGRSTDRLIHLVNELLDMARLRAGKVSLSKQRLHVGDLVHESAAGVLPLLEARGQSLRIDLPARGSARWARLTVSGDRRRLEQVLVNLLDNASKYSPAGSEIVMGATPRAGAITCFVQDEGPGLRQGDRHKVFERFYRAPSNDGSAADGSGLGLAIARSIVELHSGTIGVRSRPGGGSTFRFTLPQYETEHGHEDTCS